MITIVEVEQFNDCPSIFQLRRGNLCEEFGVWVCPAVLEIGLSKKSDQLEVRYCLPNEKQWARWRVEAITIFEKAVSDATCVDRAYEVLTSIVDTGLDSGALWHWTFLNSGEAQSNSQNETSSANDRDRGSVLGSLVERLKPSRAVFLFCLMILILWGVDEIVV